MECPRCGSSLDRYLLRGREAVGCAGCGYVGVPVEHRGANPTVESWNDAIDRLEGADPPGAATVETADAPVPAIRRDSRAESRPRPSEVRLDEPSDPPARTDSTSTLSFDEFRAEGSTAGSPSSPEDPDADPSEMGQSETAAEPTPAIVRVTDSNGEEIDSDGDTVSDADSDSGTDTDTNSNTDSDTNSNTNSNTEPKSEVDEDLTPAIVRAEGRAE